LFIHYFQHAIAAMRGEMERLEAPRSSNREEEEDDVHLCCGEVDHPFVVPAAELGELILPSL
jgi:hypothetical protein